ncbi:MAG: Fis family transcriptional regulator [Deltaproteobacteria bacterium]|nr:Fis family transcriptional regulator [Deltaproteobacteria bacterium]
MRLDKNEFFTETSKRICGSLNIETALWRCLQYLETVMPVTGMNLHLFERDMTDIRIVAHVTRFEVEKMDRLITLSKGARTRFKSDWPKMRDVMIINHPELNPFIGSITTLVGHPDSSVMVMRLEMEGKRLGALAMFAEGKGRYTRTHADLVSMLHDPFTIAMSNALKHEEVIKLKDLLADDNLYLHQELLRISGDEIIGKDKGLKGVMEMVRQVAPINSPVLLLGETGVGKEVIAQAIHNSSPRRQGPFIKVNCGAIPETLMDSELFGHEKGAFTGAVSQKRGRFERAHQGSILLDEIGDLPLPAQVRLLRVLQNGEMERVGGTKPIMVDIRVIAATHRNLEEMVIAKEFRQDLWFRLNVFPVMIPPLRGRKEDIPALVHHFLERKSNELKISPIPGLEPGTMDWLKSYQWPGNVRELENMVERALIRNRGMIENVPLVFENFASPQQENNTEHPQENNDRLPTLGEYNSMYIKKVLKITNGKIEGPNGAAEILGIHPNTLRGRMKKLGIQYKRGKG